METYKRNDPGLKSNNWLWLWLWLWLCILISRAGSIMTFVAFVVAIGLKSFLVVRHVRAMILDCPLL